MTQSGLAASLAAPLAVLLLLSAAPSGAGSGFGAGAYGTGPFSGPRVGDFGLDRPQNFDQARPDGRGSVSYAGSQFYRHQEGRLALGFEGHPFASHYSPAVSPRCQLVSGLEGHGGSTRRVGATMCLNDFGAAEIRPGSRHVIDEGR